MTKSLILMALSLVGLAACQSTVETATPVTDPPEMTQAKTTGLPWWIVLTSACHNKEFSGKRIVSPETWGVQSRYTEIVYTDTYEGVQLGYEIAGRRTINPLTGPGPILSYFVQGRQNCEAFRRLKDELWFQKHTQGKARVDAG